MCLVCLFATLSNAHADSDVHNELEVIGGSALSAAFSKEKKTCELCCEPHLMLESRKNSGYNEVSLCGCCIAAFGQELIHSLAVDIKDCAFTVCCHRHALQLHFERVT